MAVVWQGLALKQSSSSSGNMAKEWEGGAGVCLLFGDLEGIKLTQKTPYSLILNGCSNSNRTVIIPHTVL